MRGWVGAWCLSSLGGDPFASWNPNKSCGYEDKHQAPSSTPPLPLSLHSKSNRFARVSPEASAAYYQEETANSNDSYDDHQNNDLVEVINIMALSSLKTKDRDIERTIHFWVAGIEGAKTLQNQQRFNEALTT
jgi:hypothetical protein